MNWILWKLIPWPWLLAKGVRKRLAVWTYVRIFERGEREIAPLFWWYHDRTLFNGFYIDDESPMETEGVQ